LLHLTLRVLIRKMPSLIISNVSRDVTNLVREFFRLAISTAAGNR